MSTGYDNLLFAASYNSIFYSIHLCFNDGSSRWHTRSGSMNSSTKFGNGRCSPRCWWTSQTRGFYAISYPDISGHPTTVSLHLFFLFSLFPPFSTVSSHHAWIYPSTLRIETFLSTQAFGVSRSQQMRTFSSLSFPALFSRWQVLALPSC